VKTALFHDHTMNSGLGSIGGVTPAFGPLFVFGLVWVHLKTVTGRGRIPADLLPHRLEYSLPLHQMIGFQYSS
jgi:hypothetical protein